MSKKTDIIVIGGGPAAVVSAITAKKHNPNKSVALIRKNKLSPIPCGIPYVFGSLDSVDKNIIADKGLIDHNVDIIIDEVINIEPQAHNIQSKSGKKFSYEKLILATGSKPTSVPLEGISLPSVYPIRKDVEYLREIKQKIEETTNVVIIGGGFIGIEMADEIQKMGKQVTLIEMQSHCLTLAFDEAFGAQMEEKLRDKGIQILTNTKVEKITGSGQVEGILLSDGNTLPADAVILAIGSAPNTNLAKEAGLSVNEQGAVIVNEYMKTSDNDVFAVGDCAEKRDFFTRERTVTMLASTATSEARIAGMNLYQLQVLRQNIGTIGIFSTGIDNISMAAAGLTESMAVSQGFDVVIGKATAPDKHPGALKGMSMITLKLVFSKQSGTILGGQISGGVSVGEMINVIGMAIQQKLSITDLITLQIGTHPLLTSPPTAYPIISAAQDALMKLKKE